MLVNYISSIIHKAREGERRGLKDKVNDWIERYHGSRKEYPHMVVLHDFLLKELEK